jgi:hypothetical protein
VTTKLAILTLRTTKVEVGGTAQKGWASEGEREVTRTTDMEARDTTQKGRVRERGVVGGTCG